MTKNGCSSGKTLAGDGDRLLLHRFEQGRLRLRRGAVDFVGEADLREDRALLELERAAAVGRFDDHVRAEDVGGHQVGRELDAREVQVERLGERADEQRLAEAGHAFEQAVAADEQAGEHAVDDVVVADDDAADLLADGFVAGGELFGLLFDGWRPLMDIWLVFRRWEGIYLDGAE